MRSRPSLAKRPKVAQNVVAMGQFRSSHTLGKSKVLVTLKIAKNADSENDPMSAKSNVLLALISTPKSKKLVLVVITVLR